MLILRQMIDYQKTLHNLEVNGFSQIPNLYSSTEIENLINCIENHSKHSDAFIISKDLFAIRRLLQSIPDLKPLIFNKQLIELISSFPGEDYFLTKAIYFDKPSESNWFVAYHQDLIISVNKKMDYPNYINWTNKRGQLGVQPPINILENIITIRIHLDDTTKENGALKIIRESHRKGIIQIKSKDWQKEQEEICEVSAGGVMLMKPLTLHSSSRTSNGQRRRIIHLEFSNIKLIEDLNWLEFESLQII